MYRMEFSIDALHVRDGGTVEKSFWAARIAPLLQKARESIHDEILSESSLDQIVDDLHLERLQTSMLGSSLKCSKRSFHQ